MLSIIKPAGAHQFISSSCSNVTDEIVCYIKQEDETVGLILPFSNTVVLIPYDNSINMSTLTEVQERILEAHANFSNLIIDFKRLIVYSNTKTIATIKEVK